MTRMDLARVAPVTTDTLSALLAARPRRPIRRTMDRIETVLDWPAGTLERLMSGEIAPEAVETIRDEVTVGNLGDSPGERVTIELDVPQGVWEAMTPTERAEAVHVATAAALQRVREMRSESGR
jgi:hypothetical protein